MKKADSWLEKFYEIGFGNQARIVGTKRIELISFIHELLKSEKEKTLSKLYKEVETMILPEDQDFVFAEQSPSKNYNNAIKDILSLIKKTHGGKRINLCIKNTVNFV